MTASLDYVFGSKQWPSIEIKPVDDFDKEDFITDLYHDKAKPKSAEAGDQKGEWKEKNEAAAGPPTEGGGKGDAVPGKAGELPPAKATVEPGGPKAPKKEVDPQAKTAEGKSVKELQDEAEKKGKKPEAKEPEKGTAKEEAAAKDKEKKAADELTDKPIEIKFSMSDTPHTLIVTPAPEPIVEIASKRDRLSNKIGKVVARLMHKDPKPQQQIDDLKALGGKVKPVQTLKKRHAQAKTEAPLNAPEIQDMITALTDYGSKYKASDVDVFIDEAENLRSHPGINGLNLRDSQRHSKRVL